MDSTGTDARFIYISQINGDGDDVYRELQEIEQGDTIWIREDVDFGAVLWTVRDF